MYNQRDDKFEAERKNVFNFPAHFPLVRQQKKAGAAGFLVFACPNVQSGTGGVHGSPFLVQ